MYGYENYYKVKEIIEKRRKAAIDLAEARLFEVGTRSEKIRVIDAELKNTGLLLFKTACQGGDTTPIKDRNLALQRERAEELVRLGLPTDYTEPSYTCKICSDTGYADNRTCTCMRELLITENIKSSGMGSLIERQSFDNFNLSRYEGEERRRMEYNLNAARDFAETFMQKPKTLLFMGKTGTGKTHISTAIAKCAIEKYHEVLYDSTQNVVSAFETDKFKSGYGPFEPKGDKYLECDLLILDDLGAEFASQFTVSCIYNLINTRQNKGLSTIISTNLSYEELKSRYEDRIFSRLVGTDSQVLLFLGSDGRVG